VLLALSVGLSVTHGQSYPTEEFHGGGDSFDLAYSSVTFTPTSGGTSYTHSLKDIAQLPTSPAGGINLGLGDDNFTRVSLSYPREVRLFGESFPAFFVGSNGYITFTQGDKDFTETLAEHFEMLRISGLYTDLTAANEGMVTSKQLYDRVAITWQAVPEVSNSSPNTFQIEMFFDGRIRLSWLQINAEKCIVGLSNGGGLPEGFAETDFSDAGRVLLASEPSPADGARHFDTWSALTWKPGYTAVSHDVYVGSSYSSVYNGTGGTFRGNQIETGVIVGFPAGPYPDGLVRGTTYYWRIDEVEADGTRHRGSVWNFSAEEYVVVPILTELQVLDHFTELVLDTPPDLTAGGFATDLTLRFRGDPTGTAAPIYIRLEDSSGAVATVIHPDGAASKNADWTVWRTPLSKFAGVDLTKTVKVYVGVGYGEPGGGSGQAYVVSLKSDSGPLFTTLEMRVRTATPDRSVIEGVYVSVIPEGKSEPLPGFGGANEERWFTDGQGLWRTMQAHEDTKHTVIVTKDGHSTCPLEISIGSKIYYFKDILLVPCNNDSCENAMPVGNVTNLAYDTSNATFDGPGHCMDTPNLWYRYTATKTGPVTVTLEGDSYLVDPKLAIYDGASCYPAFDALIECNDDRYPDTGIWDSQITFTATEGRQYLIEVGSRADDEGGPGTMTIADSGAIE